MTSLRRAWSVLLWALVAARVCLAQAGYNDGRVMIQDFMWESSVDGKPAPAWSDYEVRWKDHWYDEVKSKAAELADAKIDLIWLPPPSNGEGAGYHPHALYNFNNNYGDAASQMAAGLLARPTPKMRCMIPYMAHVYPEFPRNRRCE